MITIKNLSYTYPEQTQTALNGVNLTIEPGEFVLLAGRSGCGKSTLLRVLNGLVPHFSGGRIVGDVEVANHRPIEVGPRIMSQFVGFVFQNPEVQAVVDQVEAEIAFGLEQIGVPSADIPGRIEQVLDQLDLQHLRYRQLHTLSGGEMQRVAIASVLAVQPKIIVLDEPTSQLDPESAGQLLEQIQTLHRELGLTIIIAEHRLDRLLPYANRLIYMDDGQVLADGPAADVILKMPYSTPLVQLAAALGWDPLPLTVEAARPFAEQIELPALPQSSTADTGSKPGQAVLTLKNIVAGYDQPIVTSADLSIYPGEVVALLGRNGSGKSTLLRTIVNLLPKMGGDILLNGRSTAKMTTAEICRQVAYMPQNPDDLLYADTVWEEPAITLRHHQLPEDRAMIDELLNQLGLAPVADRYPRDLSVGQRLRVALAAVMITKPRLIILDEPTRGLDAVAKTDLVALWQALVAQDISLLLITHDVELVATIAHRVVIMQDGVLSAGGPTAEQLHTTPPFEPQMAQLFPMKGVVNVEQVQALIKPQINSRFSNNHS